MMLHLMTPAARSRLASLVLLASLAAAFPCAAADVPAWISGGLPVASDDGDQTDPLLVADGLGGAIIAWSDSRPAMLGFCVQHLTSLGIPAPGWQAKGALIGGVNPSMSVDGAHGAMLAWEVSSVINYGHLVNGDPFAVGGAVSVEPPGFTESQAERGAAQPSSALKGARHNRLPIVLPDGAGGVLLAWMRLSIVADKLMFQRLDATGAALTGWIFVRPAGYAEYDPSMCSDDSAGAIFAWKAGYPGAIYAQRVRSDGSLPESWPVSGVRVCGEPGTHRATGIVPDGAGGAIVVWRDGRSGSFDQVYAQRVTRDGAIAAGWPAGGRAICTYPCDPGDSRFNSQYYEASSPLVADGAGGAFIVWSDKRADDGDIYCQHLLPDGSLAPGWPENGIALCSALGLQSRPAIAPDGAGGLLACWEDARGGEADVYAQRVSGDGARTPGWPEQGLAVCVAPGDQRGPRLIPDGGAGAIIAWEDHRNGNADIYAAQVTGDGIVPAFASLVSAAGRPGLARLVWYSGAPLDPRATIERREPTSDWARLALATADGSGLITLEDRDVLAGHRYGYRLAVPDGAGTSYRGEAWLDIAGAPRLALLAPYPNPSAGEVRVPFALPAGGGGALQLVDLAGRVIETQALDGLAAGAHVARIAAGRSLPPGLYRVRLSYAGSTLSARVAIVR